MDVAALNLSIDSSSVLQAANDLDRFSDAAKRAGSAAGNQNGSIAKLVATVQAIDSKLSLIVGSLGKMEGAMQQASTASKAANDQFTSLSGKMQASVQQFNGVAGSVRNVSVSFGQMESAAAQATRAFDQADAHVVAYRNHLAQIADTPVIPPATPGIIQKVGEQSRLASHHVANLGYQANDIFVSLASGQNPMMVFIQQGSQIGQIYGQSGLTLRAFASEIVALLAPLAPLIIALGAATAAVAALTREANDDSGLRKYTTAMGYTREEVEKLNSVTVTMGDTFRAVFQVGFERVASAFGINVDNLRKKWDGFLDWIVTATRAGIAGTYALVAGGAYAMGEAVRNAGEGNFNPLDALGQGLSSAYGDAQSFMDDVVARAQGNALARQNAMAEGFRSADTASASAASRTQRDPWAEILESARRQQAAIEDAGDQIGKYNQDLDQLTFTQDLFAQAVDAGIKITEKDNIALTEKGRILQGLAIPMAEAANDNRVVEFNENLNRSYEEQVRNLRQEAVELTLAGQALATYRAEQEMLNTARAVGLDQDPRVIENVREQSEAIGRMIAANDNLREQRDLTRGFFMDWVNGAREGASVFRAFSDAVINSLNRIIDKLMDQAFQNLFFGGGGGGGFFGSLLGGLGGLVGGGGLSSNSAAAAAGANYNFSPIPFANGGAFTNSVVNTPTLFRFANGGALGEMGEAGPEAIMPLKRGADGSLGVQMHGKGSPPSITIQTPITITQSGSFTTQDAQAMAQQAGQAAVTEVRRNLDAYLREWDTDGAVAA